jgi:hypothetical protein
VTRRGSESPEPYPGLRVIGSLVQDEGGPGAGWPDVLDEVDPLTVFQTWVPNASSSAALTLASPWKGDRGSVNAVSLNTRKPVRERGREPIRSPLNPAALSYWTPTASSVRRSLILISQAE